MTLDDAAAILDITEKSVVRLIRQGKVYGIQRKVGKRWVWSIDGNTVRARRRALHQRHRQ